jgi:hypothetical protein
VVPAAEGSAEGGAAMSARNKGSAFAEEVLLHISVWTSLLSSRGLSPHRTHIGNVSADLGLEAPPDFTREEMQTIMYAAKTAAIKCLFARGRRVKRRRKVPQKGKACTRCATTLPKASHDDVGAAATEGEGEGEAMKKKTVDKVTSKPVERDEWLCGYAAALSNLILTFGETTLASEMMIADGLKLDDFRKAGVEKYDLDAIKRAK